MAQMDVLKWLVAAGLVLLIVVGIARFSSGARLRRRLRKTHSRIVSKAQRPTVKFSVKVPKE